MTWVNGCEIVFYKKNYLEIINMDYMQYILYSTRYHLLKAGMLRNSRQPSEACIVYIIYNGKIGGFDRV